MAVVNNDGLVLHTTDPIFAAVGQSISDNVSSDWITAHTRLPGYSQMRVVTAIPIKEAYGFLMKLNEFLTYAVAFDLFVLIVGFVLTKRNGVAPTPDAKWWPVATVAVVMVVATGILWVAQNIQERQHLQQVLASENKSIAMRIQAHLKNRVSALQRMADRWSKMGKPPTRGMGARRS